MSDISGLEGGFCAVVRFVHHVDMPRGYPTTEARRAANKAAWADSEKNSVNRVVKRNITLDAARAAAAAIEADANGSASLNQLRRIMADGGTELFRRLDAAEIVLSYELGPGAASGVEPDTIAAGSYQFLKMVIADPNVPEALSFRALALVARVENARADVRNASETVQAKRELLVAAVNAARRQTLVAEKQWPQRDRQWWLETADKFDWPEGWPGMWQWPPATIAPAYQRKGAHAGESLRTVRATNRDDQP